MNSMPNPTEADPNDDLVARADKRLAHAYEQIARADEQLARVTENLSHMDRSAARKPADRPHGRPARRALVGLLLAACIFAAAFVWQSPQTDAIRPTIAQWLPRLVSTSAPPPNASSPPVPASASAPQLAAAAASSPAPSAPAAAQDVAPQPAAVPA